MKLAYNYLIPLFTNDPRGLYMEALLPVEKAKECVMSAISFFASDHYDALDPQPSKLSFDGEDVIVRHNLTQKREDAKVAIVVDGEGKLSLHGWFDSLSNHPFSSEMPLPISELPLAPVTITVNVDVVYHACVLWSVPAEDVEEVLANIADDPYNIKIEKSDFEDSHHDRRITYIGTDYTDVTSDWVQED